MRFSRLANENDFKKCDVYIGHYLMDDEVKRYIEQENMFKAIEFLKRKFGMGVMTAREHCNEYATFVQAKKDFEDGKAVYVHY